MTGTYSSEKFIEIANRVKAYNNCEILCIGHPCSISAIMPRDMYSFRNFDNKIPYIPMLCGIELKPCRIMKHNQIMLFPYIFEDGFPCVKGASGIIEFF